MATGDGQVLGKKNTAISSSDEYIDYRCCVCERKKVNRDAEHYCVSCQDYYCQKCVRIHDDVPSLSEHVILGKSHFKSISGVRRLPSIPTERCLDHPTKIVDIYCETHKEVGCGTCMATKHDTYVLKLYYFYMDKYCLKKFIHLKSTCVQWVRLTVLDYIKIATFLYVQSSSGINPVF